MKSLSLYITESIDSFVFENKSIKFNKSDYERLVRDSSNDYPYYSAKNGRLWEIFDEKTDKKVAVWSESGNKLALFNDKGLKKWLEENSYAVESVNEDRRFDDFKESKQGKRILEITNGKFDEKKIMDFLDNELKDSKTETEYVRAVEFIGINLGINVKSFDNKPMIKFQQEIVKKLKEYLK